MSTFIFTFVTVCSNPAGSWIFSPTFHGSYLRILACTREIVPGSAHFSTYAYCSPRQWQWCLLSFFSLMSLGAHMENLSFKLLYYILLQSPQLALPPNISSPMLYRVLGHKSTSYSVSLWIAVSIIPVLRKIQFISGNYH